MGVSVVAERVVVVTVDVTHACMHIQLAECMYMQHDTSLFPSLGETVYRKKTPQGAGGESAEAEAGASSHADENVVPAVAVAPPSPVPKERKPGASGVATPSTSEIGNSSPRKDKETPRGKSPRAQSTKDSKKGGSPRGKAAATEENEDD